MFYKKISKFILENNAEISEPFVVNSRIRKIASPLLINFFQEFLNDSLYYSENYQDQFVKRRISYLLRQIYNIPFWKKKLDEADYPVSGGFSYDKFRKIPFLTREEIFSHSNLDANPGKKAIYDAAFKITTSGSMSYPGVAILDPRLMPMRESIWREQFKIKEHLGKDRVASLAVGNTYGFIKKYWNYYTLYGDNENTVIKEIYDFKPNVLVSSPSRLMVLIRLLEEKDFTLNIKKVYLVGETLTTEIRGYFERYFKCPTVNVVGMAETGGYTYECEYKELHIYPHWLFIEIVNERGENVENGEKGRIVITHFHNFISPIVRYLTGDLGTLRKEKCNCGRTSPRILLEGREVEFFVFKNGERMPLNDVIDKTILPLAGSIKKYQFIQKEQGKLSLFIMPTKNSTNVELLEKHLIRNFSSVFKERSADVKIEFVDSLPNDKERWKERYFISYLKNN
jgi:phenylacetate-CoA ligase